MTHLLRRPLALTAALTTATLLTAGLTALPLALPDAQASSAPAAPSDATDAVHVLGDAVAGLADLDTRGRAAPTAAQHAAAGALDAVVRWNEQGTPASISPVHGSLGAVSGPPAAAARTWLRQHAAVLGLTAAQVDGLELVNAQRFAGSGARAVLFRQRFGDLVPAIGSMVTVGVADGRVEYVSSSLARTSAAPAAAKLTPRAAWLKAAANVGRAVAGDDVRDIVSEVAGGWTRLRVPGFAQEQQVRLRALADADGTVHPVFEANVVDVAGGAATAYTLLVDAVTGEVRWRHNQVDQSSDAAPFSGEITATDCGPVHRFELTDGLTRRIDVTATAVNPVNDIVVKILDPQGQVLASGDLGTSPEVVSYTAEKIAAGVYGTQVCPFGEPTVPLLPPYNYAAVVTTSDQAAPEPGSLQPSPRWRWFPANPALDFRPGTVAGGSKVGCWVAGDGCTLPTGPLANPQAPGPWDTIGGTGLPSMTTIGNNANTHEAWASPLTPGGTAQAPISPTRDYTAEFTDAWNNSGCDPAQLVPGGNDVDAVVTSLFAAHNRMHDFSYYLGFTEANYNLQLANLGRGGVEGDPEVGNAQAGALTGGNPSYLGRDNANQITLQDGVPGITNQYLFQPIAGAFYSPCADGGLDMSVVGHEYTHAISNRMVGGPDEGLTSEHGGAMGESWGDLVGMEYLFAHDYDTGTNPYVVGPYATGNKRAGIRDFPLHRNPLNFSNYGFDITGAEVHADGEIWNGVQFTVRKALIKRWNKKFPVTDRKLQLRCAQGNRTSSPLPARFCPGNRRWVQLMFDSFLLQQGATSMVDARDAMLAADRMRFGGANQKVLWKAFAQRGLGAKADVASADDPNPKASFRIPQGQGRNATVRFRGPAGKVYVGRFQARTGAVADTVDKTERPAKVVMAPGRYRLLFVSKKRGFTRLTVTLRAGRHRVVRLTPRRNVAAARSGAKVIAASAGSLNAASLIDGDEATNWGGVSETNVDETRPYVAVDLAGKKPRTIRRAAVSAFLTPAPAAPSDVPLAADPDPDSGSRFTALRSFALERCVRKCRSASATWKRFFTSAGNAFPAVRPRPVAPDLTLRYFRFDRVKARAVRLVALENQCTGYAGYAGEQDNDPLNATDCKTASDRGSIVHAAELQLW